MVESTQGPSKRVIAGRYEVGDRRWGDDTAALHEAVDLLVGRAVLLEVIPGGTDASVAIHVPGATPPKRTGVWDGTAVAVHDWAPAAPVLATDDDAAKAQIAELVAVLEGLAAAGTVHGGILPESVVLHGGARLTTAGAALAASGVANGPFASPARRRGAAPRPADDAWAVAAVLAMSLSGTVPTIAAAPALTAAASAARPELVPALAPLLARVQTPAFAPITRVSGWRRRRGVAAGVILALTGGGTAAALIATSAHETRTPPASESSAAASPATATNGQTIGATPSAIVPTDVATPDNPVTVSTPGLVPPKRASHASVLDNLLLPGTPAAPELPVVVLPPVLEPPVSVPKPPKIVATDETNDDHADQGLHFGLGHLHHEGDSDGVHVPQGPANGHGKDDDEKGNRKTQDQ